MTTRREFLKRGLFGGAILIAAGAGLGLWPTRMLYAPRRKLAFMDPREFAILASVAARVVGGPGADPVEIAHHVEEVLARGAVEAQGDFRRLLRLFDSALFGLVDGHARPFTALAPEDQDRALEAWAHSRLVLRRSGYKALRNLCMAAHYATPSTWASVGYPGPPEISQPAGQK